jgi:hypothetical protein
MTRFPVTLLLGPMVGCSSAPVPLAGLTFSQHSREVVLSREHPQDDFLKAKLVAIANDGTTTIQSLEDGDTLRAAPGRFFAPGPYGSEGLQLLSASAAKHEPRLLRTWCESK